MLVLAVVSVEVPLALSLRDRVDSEVRLEAQSQADVVASSAADFLAPRHAATLSQLAGAVARSVSGRVVVVGARGRVLADSATRATLGESYAGRPEIAAALRGRGTQGRRYSHTLGEELLATAMPILRSGRPVGAVRITQSIAAVGRAVDRVTVELVLLGVLVLVLGLAAGALIAAQVSRPILRLEAAARRVADGELDARAAEEGSAEQRSLARSFNDMTARLGRLLRAQREFVADASHQLRTPLTAARLRLDEARAAGLSPAAARELAAGDAEIRRMAQIIDELLVLSRAGERELPAQAVDLADAARRARERWAPAAAAAGTELSLEAEPTAGAGRCAPADLDRALDALIENAVRYGGGVVTLAAGPHRLEVRDRGSGLRPGEEDAVWDRFHRGSAAAGVPGTGLGLPIARELIGEWGGTVALRNRPGGGAVATLTLPAAQPEAAGRTAVPVPGGTGR